MKIKLHKKIFYSGTLELITGLHIGDSKDNVEIGGVDSPILRRKDNKQPYIPGSSLKGKIRCLLDIVHGFEQTTKNNNSLISKLFGANDGSEKSENSKNPKYPGRPSRLIVRDAFLSESSQKKLSETSNLDLPYSEIKPENSIDRIKGTAENPRFIERVPAGSIFDVNFVINIITENDADNPVKIEEEFDKLLKYGIELLNDDYLGGSGSRGYGQVKINLGKPIIKEYTNAAE